MSENRALLYAVLGNVIFGFSFIFTKMAIAVTTPIVLLSVRFTVAFLIMTVACLFMKEKPSYRGKSILPLLFLGLIQPVAYFLCETYGLRLSTSSFAGSIIAMIPIFCLVIASVAIGERTTSLQKLCIIVSVAGAIITSLGKSEGTTTALGFVLLLGAAVSGASCNVLFRKFSTRYTPFEQNYVMFALGSVVFTAIALAQNRGNIAGAYLAPMSSGRFWLAIAFLSGLSSVGAFLLTATALTRLPASLVSPIASVTSVVSILAGVLFLREDFTLLQAVGSVIIVVATALINTPFAKRERRKPEAAEKAQV